MSDAAPPTPESMPSPEEMQARISELMSAHFGATADFADEIVEKPDPLIFDKLPRDIKAHLDRYVIKQDEAKKVLSIAVCDHYNHVRHLRTLRAEDAER